MVYGYPAIAIPISKLQTKAIISPAIRAPQDFFFLQAPDINFAGSFTDLPKPNIFIKALQLFKDTYHLDSIPSFKLSITSQIPVASGLGSSASISVATIRAISQYLGLKLPDERVNSLAFELEKVHHGNPSGIDNTVINYEKTLYYIRDTAPQFLQSLSPFQIVLMNSGIHSLTSEVVADVKAEWQRSPQRLDSIFEKIGAITEKAKNVFESGPLEELGAMMTTNHTLLQEMGVSIPELDNLVKFALDNRALGAKLCGAGRGGNVIALVDEETIPSFKHALNAQGIKSYFLTTVE